MSDVENPANAVKKNHLALITRPIFFVLALLLFGLSNLGMPDMIETSDYTCTFYTPAKLVAEGRLSELYPSLDDKRLADTAYNKAAHEFLPHLPPYVGTAYSYPPCVALFVSPLTIFSPAHSLMVFQIISIAAFAAAAYFISGTTIGAASNAFFSAFYFVPLIVVLWIGQIDVVSTILPSAGMFLLLKKQKEFAAGLIGAMAMLKLQLAVIPCLVAVVLLSQRKWKTSAGMALGIAILSALCVGVFGIQVCAKWPIAMKLMETDFLSTSAGVARYLAISWPRFMLYMAPETQVGNFRPLVYGMAATFLIASILTCARLAKRCSENLDVIKMTIVVACLTIPMIAPHLFYYDLSAMTLAGMLIFTRNGSDTQWQKYMRKRAAIFWIITSAYPLAFKFTYSMYLPLVILIPAALLYFDVLRYLWSYSDLTETRS